MKVCQNCTAYEDPECTIYQRIPPHTFAERCKHFIMVAEYVPPPVEAPEPEPACQECGRHDDGYCLRLDHPNWKYNFVKIKDGIECQLKARTE